MNFGGYPYFRKPPNGDLVDKTMDKGWFIVELPTNNGGFNDLPTNQWDVSSGNLV